MNKFTCEVTEQYQFDALMALAKSIPDMNICGEYSGSGWTEWPYFYLIIDELKVRGAKVVYGTNVSFIEMIKLLSECKKPITKTIKLTSDYDAVVNKKAQTVTVGCQTIKFDKVEEIYKFMTEK